jgi:hypothetical protein
MESKKFQPMNISTSWTQPWPGAPWAEQMDDVQLEILIQDMFFEETDTTVATQMLNQIGIRT